MARVSGGDKFEKALKDLTGKIQNGASVQVGFLAKATYPDGTPVAFVAAMNEYGHAIGAAPAAGEEDTRQRVPPRPFFRNMISNKRGEWPEAIAKNLKSTGYDVKKTMGLVGSGIAGQLRDSIIATNSPPLAASTIARKGFDKPLVDTGHMLDSVDYEVDAE